MEREFEEEELRQRSSVKAAVSFPAPPVETQRREEGLAEDLEDK